MLERRCPHRRLEFIDFELTPGPQLITALSEGSPSHRLRPIERRCDSQKRAAENKDLSSESQARGYGEAGGEGLLCSFRISQSLTHRFAVPPLPQAGEGRC